MSQYLRHVAGLCLVYTSRFFPSYLPHVFAPTPVVIFFALAFTY
jgi:hypothetical protein